MEVLKIFLFCVMLFGFIDCRRWRNKTITAYEMKPINEKYSNPNYVKDRPKDDILKPIMPESFTKYHTRPFNPAWMDYCAPYHCNDYHKLACGLNRRTLRFRWFQSNCHIIQNNFCSPGYQGSLKYDKVENKFCSAYVKHYAALRGACSPICKDETVQPVCGLGTLDSQIVLFQNRCKLESVNCREQSLKEYAEIDMNICYDYVLQITDK